jgi:hypothetical protein
MILGVSRLVSHAASGPATPAGTPDALFAIPVSPNYVPENSPGSPPSTSAAPLACAFDDIPPAHTLSAVCGRVGPLKNIARNARIAVGCYRGVLYWKWGKNEIGSCL